MTPLTGLPEVLHRQDAVSYSRYVDELTLVTEHECLPTVGRQNVNRAKMVLRGITAEFSFDIVCSIPIVRADGFTSKCFSVAHTPEVVNISTANPYCAISRPQNTSTKLAFIEIVGDIPVEAAKLFPKPTPYKKGAAGCV